jgi:hypothetical protein
MVLLSTGSTIETFKVTLLMLFRRLQPLFGRKTVAQGVSRSAVKLPIVISRSAVNSPMVNLKVLSDLKYQGYCFAESSLSKSFAKHPTLNQN